MIKFEIRRDLLKKLINSHKKFAERTDTCLFSCFNFKLTQNMLKVSTTDGKRALQSTIEVNNISGNNAEFNIKSQLIKDLVIYQSNIPALINVTVDASEVTFEDYLTRTKYKYALEFGNYPDIQKLLDDSNYKEQNYAVKLNKKFFKDLEALLSDTTEIINLNFDKEDNIKPILINAGFSELKQTGLFLPEISK